MFNKKVAVLFSTLALIAGSAFAAYSSPIAPAFGQVMMAPTAVPVNMPATQSSFALPNPQFRFDIGPAISFSQNSPSGPLNHAEETNEAISWIFLLGGLTIIIKGLANMFKPATTPTQRLAHVAVGLALIVIGVAVPMLWVANIAARAFSGIGCG